ncbi:DUF7310 family coiled-coil domain-containing protein [Halolamina salina]|uniref:DUF7310 domain-containing protein n=1 Tax=Halolamina salina TaxID=1220023 RepID=A0ABD6B9I6_9EURY
MPDSDAELERRLAAVERAVDGERRGPAVSDADAAALESRIETLESRVDELDAAVQSVRGFLGGVSAVNESVERRADTAVAAVERLERRLDERDDAPDGRGDGAEPTGVPATVAEGSIDENDSAEKTDTEGTSDAENGSDTDESAESGLCERLRELR